MPASTFRVSPKSNRLNRINVLMVGTGEYTTGYVHDRAAPSDKGAGVVALTMFDLRRRGIVGHLMMAGTKGGKFPGIRKHLKSNVGDMYLDISTDFHSFPADDVQDSQAYLAALDELAPGDVVTVFTPDDTHAAIAEAAICRGCHVLVAKPLVKRLDDHLRLSKLAAEHNVIVAMEVHKRWDPMYRDARDRIRNLGDFSSFQSYMSQPKSQLETFRLWAGKRSDISYYLNAHHVDFHVWSVADRARPISVYATCATGYATTQGVDAEDTISLHTVWENTQTGNLGSATYTASWIAPQSDVHSQQRFFYMGHGGEVTIDQAHRGYSIATDEDGVSSPNPLFMKYTPDTEGRFAGQDGYGYRSIGDFVLAARSVRDGSAEMSDFHGRLATADDTVWVTGILEAGRRSLDEGRVVSLVYDSEKLVGLE